MKTIITTFALVLTTLLVNAQKRLVADVYPGAMMMNTADESLILTRNSGYSTANAEAYLIRDTKEKVVAFYKKKSKKVMPCENGDQYLEMQSQHTSDYGLMSAGVVISSNPHKKTPHEEIGGFDELRQLVKQNFHTEDEFKAVYERYKHLNHAFFNITAEEDKMCGGFLNLQEQLYKMYTEKINSADLDKEMQGLVTKIENLTQEGRYEEAHTLTGRLRDQMEKATLGVGQTDTWATWLEYFNILERNSFKSIVIIHKPISQWHTADDVVVSQK
jgi:hypothetical protein